MVGRRITSEPTTDDHVSYLRSVSEAFHYDRTKYDEFLQILRDFAHHRIDSAGCIARVDELFKDHWNLLRGFYSLCLPELRISLPAEVNRTIPPEATIIPPEAEKPTYSEALDLVEKTKEAFHAEPEKYDEFLKLLADVRARRVDLTRTIARMEDLVKDNWSLRLGFYAFLPSETAPDINKRKRAGNFMSRLKRRHKSINPQVYESFCEMLKMYVESNKPISEVYHEVVTFLQGKDLPAMELSDLFSTSIS